MSFFVSTPVGRILNRFSKDTAVTDNVLVRQVLDIVLVGSSLFIQEFLLATASLIIAVMVFPAMLLVVPFLLLAASGAIYLARRPIIDSLRYDALSRSPINSLFVASLSNLPTIRAYEQGEWLRRHFEDDLV